MRKHEARRRRIFKNTNLIMAIVALGAADLISMSNAPLWLGVLLSFLCGGVFFIGLVTFAVSRKRDARPVPVFTWALYAGDGGVYTQMNRLDAGFPVELIVMGLRGTAAEIEDALNDAKRMEAQQN